jgi:hypothetical protein
MYDSIRVGFALAPTSEQLEKWDKVKVREKHFENHSLTKKTSFEYETWLRFKGGSIHVIYYPQDLHNEPEPLLLFEMSLPKLVYGDNIHMLFDPSLAIERAHQIISQHSHVPMVDLNQGVLYRIDLCYNFLVGEFVSEWIRQLFKLKYPRRKTKPYYPFEGVQYYSQKASLSYYGKEAETRDSNAQGILRMEATWRDKSQIGQLVGKPLAKIGDFPIEVVDSLLNAELEKLGIKDRAPFDSLAPLRILVKKYRPEQGRRLYGTLSALQKGSSADLKAMGITKQTISRDRKAIIAAELCMCTADNEIALPVLVITPRSPVE